jgi:hypothetical protein
MIKKYYSFFKKNNLNSLVYYMSSNRISYDDSAYQADVKRSVDPLFHSLSNYYVKNCDTCLPEPSVVGPMNVRTLDNDMIDVENILTNRDWKMDKKQFNSEHVDVFLPTVNRLGNKLALNNCMNGELTATNSLLLDPKVNYKALPIQHLVFTGLPVNPQDVIPVLRNPGFVSSRDIAINEYKKNLKAMNLQMH